VKTTFDHQGLKIYISECPIFASVHSGLYERGHYTSMSAQTHKHTHTGAYIKISYLKSMTFTFVG